MRWIFVRARRWIVARLMRPVWIVSVEGELGLRILGLNLLYHGSSRPLIGLHEEYWREVGRAEFGEVIRVAGQWERVGEASRPGARARKTAAVLDDAPESEDARQRSRSACA